MGDIKAEWENALTAKDCERLLELFDDYIEAIEDEEVLRRELGRLEGVVVDCDDPYELVHEIAHVYAHLDDTDAGIWLYRRIAERRKDDPEEYATALYYLADAYEHFGMPEKAIETYEELLKLEEEVLKNEREIALTLANIAVNYDEIGETEKAIKLMERAREIFERLNDEKNHMISLLDLAHFRYELGDYDAAEALIGEVLRKPREDEIEVNARLVEAEIFAGREEYGKTFRAIRDALLKAVDTSDEIFGLVFDTLVDFIEGLFNEGSYGVVAENMEAFAELFEDDTVYFFRAIGELARWKAGEEGAKERFDELYSRVENEELKAILDEWKRPKLSLSLGL
ncbi:tetratricopeptide repeat protein [Thermococcus indicus]|uniref:Tetratricopeptide repeat protein n=1 Tax=Thermococcus indicus TaxID=2586643 RepID=A0A4Y5SMW0_9EURY|nr:tetratricopeptide repeat protein [Thermococcus indicus]QDA32237.1 tetratricopeptide repeat protein [Thermococcus indicus]